MSLTEEDDNIHIELWGRHAYLLLVPVSLWFFVAGVNGLTRSGQPWGALIFIVIAVYIFYDALLRKAELTLSKTKMTAVKYFCGFPLLQLEFSNIQAVGQENVGRFGDHRAICILHGEQSVFIEARLSPVEAEELVERLRRHFSVGSYERKLFS